MTLIKFKRPYEVYNSGETAMFTDDISERLIDAGYADKAPKKGTASTPSAPSGERS